VPMTVVVTREVSGRIRGFLGSCMLEIAPGVYVSPRMSKGVRQRVWTVLTEWFPAGDAGGLVITWRDPTYVGGQGVASLGLPPKEIRQHDGMFLSRREVAASSQGVGSSLKYE
jgi:CRISPR-associated protein Cas2